MELVERADQLGALEGLLMAGGDDRCQVVLISGAPGTGKSILLQELSERAIAKGAVALTAYGSKVTSAIPLHTLSQLRRAADPFMQNASSELLADLLQGGITAAEARESKMARAAIIDGLCIDIARLSKKHPILIGIDNINYADKASLQWLQHLMSQLALTRVLFVLSESGEEGSWYASFHVHLLQQAGFRHIWLTPLSRNGVHDMLSEYIGSAAAQILGAECYALSGGNPLLVRALIDDYHDAAIALETLPASFPVGNSFSQALLTCLRCCDQVTRAVANGLAVLGLAATPALLGQLLAMSVQSVGHGLNALASVGLVAETSFRHDAVARAVLDGMPTETRHGLHQRAAQILRDVGAPALAIAHHLLVADHIAEPWAAEILLEAATGALRGNQPQLAISYLELALLACQDETEWTAVTMMLAATHWRFNPLTASQYFDLLSDPTGHNAAVLIKAMLWHGRFDDVVQVLDRLASTEQDPETMSARWLVLQQLRTTYPGLLEHVGVRLDEAPAGRLDAAALTPRMYSAKLLATVLGRGVDESMVPALEQLLRGAHLDDEMVEAVEAVLFALIYADQADKAAAWCDRLLEEVAGVQAPTWHAIMSAIRAEIAFRQGNLPLAEALGRKALSHLPPRSWGVAVGVPVATLVLATTAMGRRVAAAEFLDLPAPEAMMQTRYGLHYIYARGQYNLAVNRLHNALSDFLTCGNLMRGWGIDLPAMVPWRSAAASTLLRLGNASQARHMAEEQVAKLGNKPSRCRGLSLRVLAKAHETRRRPSLLREAVTDLQGSGDQLELARALSELGRAYYALGESGRASDATRIKAGPSSLRRRVRGRLGASL